MPIFTSIAAAISGALFAGSAIATSIIAGGLAFAAQLGISYLNRPKKQKYTAVQGEVQYGADVDVGTVFGISKVAGHRAYYAKWGSGNKVNADVFALANGWCDGLEPYVYFYGEKYNLVARDIIGNEAAHYGIDGFEDLVSIRFYDGRPGQGPDTQLVARTLNLGNSWKATSVGAGICYVVIERTYDSDKFSKGRPDFEWVLRGLREYDPRKDSTVGGGSGPQRLDNPATWAHSKNPAVHRLNYQLGLRGLVSNRTLIGEGKSLGQLDLSTYFVAMNVSDTVREGKPTYECSLWVDGSMDHTEILKEFDDAMAGYGLNRRGLSGIIPGAPQVPVLEITADDIPVDRAQDLQRRKSAFDLYNYISGQFTSIDSMWNPESLTPVYVNADIAADGRRRQTPNDFLQVTDPDIGQYLLNIRYRQNRKGGTATVPVSRRIGLAVQEGEWVNFEGVTWLVNEWQCDENFRFTLKLSETGADIYDDGDILPGPIVIPPLPPINPSLLSTVQNFRVAGGMISAGNGYEKSALQFTWDPPEDPTIIAVRIFFRVDNGSTEEFQETCMEPEAGTYTTTKNILSDQVYVARATITTNPDRLKTFTPWVTSATATGIDTLIADLAHLGQDVVDRMSEIQFDIDAELRPIIRNLLDAFELTGTVNEVQRRELKAEVAGALAQIVEESRVRASESEAMAQLFTMLQARVGRNLAQLVVEETARATADEALSQRIIQLTAQTAEDIEAAVQVEQTARTTADEALAEQVSLVQANVGTVQAAVQNEATARANGDGALSQQIGLVQSDVDDVSAAVQTETSARVAGDQALAQSVTQVEAKADGVSANGYFSVKANTSGSQLASLELAARAVLNGQVAQAAYVITVENVGGTLRASNLFLADRTVFVSGDWQHAAQVFVIDENGATLNVANIGLIRAGRLLSLNNKVDFNLDAGTLEVFS